MTVIALCVLWETQRQIRLSNKCYLYEWRQLSNLIVLELYEPYDKYPKSLECVHSDDKELDVVEYFACYVDAVEKHYICFLDNLSRQMVELQFNMYRQNENGGERSFKLLIVVL